MDGSKTKPEDCLFVIIRYDSDVILDDLKE